MKYIEHIVEPDRLLLSWQTSIPGKSRQRKLIAELTRNGDDADLTYLEGSDDFLSAQNLEFEGYPGFGIEKEIHQNILGSFMKRLPPRSRGDFDRFLNALRINPESKAEISDFALLGYSGAKLPDDDFTVINPFENASVPFELIVSVQGYQHYQENMPISELSTDMQAVFEAEPDNAYDPEAIKIMINGVMAGYVSRGLTGSFHKWIQSDLAISAYIERINGTEQHPDIYLYVSVK